MSFKVVYVVMVTECSEWDHFIAKYVKLCSQWVAAIESGPRTCSLIITSVILSNIFQLFFFIQNNMDRMHCKLLVGKCIDEY